MQKFFTAAATFAVTIASVPAFAHVTGVEHAAGTGHPVLGIDHLLVLLAVGVVAGIAWVRRR
ncbi:MAG: HupE/UreJ family protein [Proteobacteria bacterium]|nr:HupE/UreJ family protein [Pseudomonadota bacterium]